MSVRTKNPSPGKFDCPPINITDLLNRPRPSGLTLPSGISLPTSLPTGILGGASGGSGGVGGFGGSRVLWSTGNERTVNRINALGKLGNFVTTTAEMSPFMIMELMNESKEDAEYYLRFRYEVLDKDAPEAEGYQQSAAIWMDVGGCTGSDVPAKEGVYEVKSPEFKVAYGGRLISTHAHLHDGGTFPSFWK